MDLIEQLHSLQWNTKALFPKRKMETIMMMTIEYLTIICQRRSEYCRIIPRQSRGGYSTIFTEPEENNCFSIIAQVIISESNCLFFHFIRFFFKNFKKSRGFSIIITSRWVIIARYDVILDQSERAHLYNHLSNYTKKE